MRSAQRVATHLLQFAHAVILDGIRKSCADARVILVIARALQLDRLSIQEEAFVCVEVPAV